jgi:deoxyribodipyrimidine photo-lyase
MSNKLNIVWLRRDLRLEDNTALNNALSSGLPVLPLFIFDTGITDELKTDDPRITLIYKKLDPINKRLSRAGSSIRIIKGDPIEIWKGLLAEFSINAVYVNKDYEPYARERDSGVKELLGKYGIPLLAFKDQVIFEDREIIKADDSPYTVFTPYKNKWVQEYARLQSPIMKSIDLAPERLFQGSFTFPSLNDLGFRESSIIEREYDLSILGSYEKYRNIPSADKTSYLSPHLRFGTVSIRRIVESAYKTDTQFLNELIWREFFMQILSNYPHVVTENFRSKYDNIEWRNNEADFEKWCRGETGYPIVDAGMRQLNETGYMHNRVRMITAGFLCKHLLIDWRWGEAYFAEKLLDYELSSNNGNWQWAAGTGCDAAPYFRIFSPDAQEKRFDPKREYIRKWVKDLNQPTYPKPIVEHEFARKRALEVYKTSIKIKPAR